MTDFNAILFAQITDLQGRVSKQDAVITALKAEVDRLSSKSTIPLTQWTPSTPVKTHPQTPNAPVKGPNPRTRTKVSIPYPTMSISDVLKKGETVSVEIRTGKDSFASAICSFDGKDLTIIEADLAKPIIGLKTSKPGEILYKFMEELHTGEHISKKFECAPWKLCFVTRDGNKKCLEELRDEN